jgi:hypothetical protein
MLILLFVVVTLVMLVRIMLVLVMVTVGMGIPGRMTLVGLGLRDVHGLVRVPVELPGSILVIVVRLGGRRFLDGGLSVRLRGDYRLVCLDWLGNRLYWPGHRFGRHSRLAFRHPRGNGFRRGSLESFRLLRRQRHVLARLVGLFRNRVGVFGVLLQCAELFSGQRPGAIMIGGA